MCVYEKVERVTCKKVHYSHTTSTYNMDLKTITITPENIGTLEQDDAVLCVTWRAGSLTAALRLFPNTLYLDISNCDLTSLNELLLDGEPIMPFLLDINCSLNHIPSIKPLRYQFFLGRLDCSYNDITSMTGLESLTRLIAITSNGNKITNYHALMYCSKLYQFNHDASEQVINTQPEPVRICITNPRQASYCPAFYPHDAMFKASADAVVKAILTRDQTPGTPFSEIDDGELAYYGVPINTIIIIRKLCARVIVHQVFGITFSVLMAYLWARIMTWDLTGGQSGILESIIQRFSAFMNNSLYLSINSLFRYAALAISSFFCDVSVTYSKVSILDQKISAIESAHPDFSTEAISVCVATELSQYRRGDDSMLSIPDVRRMEYPDYRDCVHILVQTITAYGVLRDTIVPRAVPVDTYVANAA